MADIEAGPPYVDFEVLGRPATFATAHEAEWKAAIRQAVAESGVDPRPDACFALLIEFRTPKPRTLNDRWDIDNLVKPTMDAMEGIFGVRAWAGAPQPNDDKVVRLEASKRTVADGEQQGARVTVWILE